MEFKPVELLKLAVNMEEISINFYKTAEAFVKDPALIDIYRELILMEQNHHKLFSEMEASAAKAEDYQDSAEATAYLVDNYAPAFFKIDQAGRIGVHLKTAEEIFQYALQMEKETIEYYTFMALNVNYAESEKTIRFIILEESKHSKIITERLKEFKH
jgi:rubrerythrin